MSLRPYRILWSLVGFIAAIAAFNRFSVAYDIYDSNPIVFWAGGWVVAGIGFACAVVAGLAFIAAAKSS